LQQLSIRHVENVIYTDQGLFYARGVESWLGQILARDRKIGEIDHLNEQWAADIEPIEIEGGKLTGSIEDLQGRFNLNNLVSNDGVSELDLQRFRGLLKALDLDATLADAVVDWIDADSEVTTPQGAEDGAYLVHDPPYRAGNLAMVSVGELRLVRGFDAPVYEKIKPHVCALPERTEINVNTATVPVLQAISDALSKTSAKALISARGQKGYKDIQQFARQPQLAGRDVPLQGLGVSSRFFLTHARVRMGRTSVQLWSVLRRDNATQVDVLYRSKVRL
jgi:general secretion pathway protein K